MTAILGISAYYHDSAAALVVDGRIVAAAQEERFTRKKHDDGFPTNAIAYCLREAGLDAGQLDYVGFYDKPFLKFERLIETYLAYAPAGFRSFCKSMPLWLQKKLHLPKEMRRELNQQYRKRFIFTEHHQSHAASAFFPSPFEEAAIMTWDGVGEWTTAGLGYGSGSRIRLTYELRFPHSLGLLYSAVTYFCGFKVNSGEYKLMGLAPYGEPRFREAFLKHIVDLKPDGSFRLDMRYFNYCQGFCMTSRRFEKLFGGPPRRPESPVTQREMDLAASVQAVTEEIVLRAARHLYAQRPLPNLCLAGGVALNCVANGRLLREGPFEHIWVQPAAGDAGGALGVALFIWHQLLEKPRIPCPTDSMSGALLGPAFTADDVRQALRNAGAVFHEYEDSARLDEEVAEWLEQGRVVGWVQGRMEFGPRALGSRSILGDARNPEMQSQLNLKTKFRESFRPFAPIVLRDHVHEYFETRRGEDSPYMLLVAPVAAQHRLTPDASRTGFEKLKQIRSDIPAVTHVDYSARLQTVDPDRHPRLWRLLTAFHERTGCPVLINTSFNVRGEPIVCTPEDALRCFMAMNMDILVIENFVLHKSEQRGISQERTRQHLEQFALD